MGHHKGFMEHGNSIILILKPIQIKMGHHKGFYGTRETMGLHKGYMEHGKRWGTIKV